jgi:hypothetical protein
MRRILIAVLATLLLVPAATAPAAGTQEDRLDLLNHAIRQVYAGAPSCRPPDPFSKKTTVTDADPSAELLNTFAIFRRPATEAELAQVDGSERLPAQGLYRRYVRIARSASGRQALIVPAQNTRVYQPRPQRCIDALHRRVDTLLRGRDAAFKRATNRVLKQVIRDEWAGPAKGPAEGLYVFTHNPGSAGGGGGGGLDVDTVRTEGMAFSIGGRTRGTLVTTLIPDGVASIAILYPASATQKAVERTLAVRDNIVSYRVSRPAGDALQPQMTWLAADGSVVRVVHPVAYAPNCGNTSYLDFRPAHWSAGCMAGSLNLSKVRWRWWDSARTASGTAEAVLRNGCVPDCITSGVTRAKAKIVLSRPLACTAEDGTTLQYFSRARVSILYRTGNKLGERPGWQSTVETVEPDMGGCTLAGG